MNRNYFVLTEAQFARLKPLLPTDTWGKPRVDDRRVISGIVHVLKSGCRWVDAPPIYGPRKTLYNRFQRWAAKGVWVDIFHALASTGCPPGQVIIDSSAVKAHRCASGGKGGSKIRRSARAAAARPRPVRSKRLPHPQQWHSRSASGVDDTLDRLIAAGSIERLAGHRCHELGTREALSTGSILAKCEDQTTDASAGEGRMRIHRTHAGGIMRGVEQRRIAPG
jgi:transposase